jgi:hypothetical protein
MLCGKREGMTRTRLSAICILFAAAALSACTSTDVLNPSAIASDTQSAPPAAGQASTTATTTAPASTATTQNGPTSAVATVSRLQFAPIVGTPVEAAGPLSERLAQRAREKGIALARTGEPQSHILKGYFSALPEGKQTTIVYVWDVLDASGNRLHRIQGQQVVQGGDGWSSVSAATMQGIADQTMEQLATWLQRSTG